MESRFWEIKKLCGDSGPAMASSGYNSRPRTARHATRALYFPKILDSKKYGKYGKYGIPYFHIISQNPDSKISEKNEIRFSSRIHVGRIIGPGIHTGVQVRLPGPPAFSRSRLCKIRYF